MASILGVKTVQHTNGTTALTIDSTGRILTPARPAFSADKSGNFSTSSTAAKMTGWAENFNTGGYWDNSNSKFVAPVAGVYQFNYTGLHNTGAAGTGNWVRAQFRLNGNNIVDGLGDQGSYGGYQRVTITVAWELSVDDEIEVYAASANSSGYVYGSNSYTVFSGYLVG